MIRRLPQDAYLDLNHSLLPSIKIRTLRSANIQFQKKKKNREKYGGQSQTYPNSQEARRSRLFFVTTCRSCSNRTTGTVTSPPLFTSHFRASHLPACLCSRSLINTNAGHATARAVQTSEAGAPYVLRLCILRVWRLLKRERDDAIDPTVAFYMIENTKNRGMRIRTNTSCLK